MLLIKAFLSGALATSTRVQQSLEDGQERKGEAQCALLEAVGTGKRETGTSGVPGLGHT